MGPCGSADLCNHLTPSSPNYKTNALSLQALPPFSSSDSEVSKTPTHLSSQIHKQSINMPNNNSAGSSGNTGSGGAFNTTSLHRYMEN